MGVDFTAILDHRLRPADLLDLPARLSENSALRRSLQQADEALVQAGIWSPEQLNAPHDCWDWDNWRDGNATVELIERAWEPEFESVILKMDRVMLSLGPMSCSVSYGRWAWFLTITELTDALRRVAWEFTQVLEAPSRAIYVPDSAYCPSRAQDELDRTIEDIEIWLRDECGPPCGQLQDIYVELGDTYTADGYFIDDLSDISPHDQVS